MNEIQNHYNKLCTEAELAKIWGVSTWTIRRFRLNEGLPVVKIGGRFFFRMETVESWLTARETAGAPDDAVPVEVGKIRQIKA